MTERLTACRRVLDALEEGRCSPPVALMQLLIEAEDEALVERVVREAAMRSEKAAALLPLVEQNASGCARIAAMLRADVDVPPQQATIEEGVAFCQRLFDWSVQQSEEASVALYSLGNPTLLDEATREIVDLLRDWGVLGPTRDALDIGCGIGRMEVALSPLIRQIHGIDVSSRMIDVARRRCAARSNVTFATCSGLDLGELSTASFDLVLAIDSFPYLVQSGEALAAAHFAEVARVLRCGADFVILGFSYRDDPARDRADVASLARTHGFRVEVAGTTPFALWNAMAFRMIRQG
jgi:ubiquinone/menaquinone biosynthesis C-methylase UbiE